MIEILTKTPGCHAGRTCVNCGSETHDGQPCLCILIDEVKGEWIFICTRCAIQKTLKLVEDL